MQAIVETVFDAVYLVSVITIGILMIRGCKGSHQFKLFGLMAVVLGRRRRRLLSETRDVLRIIMRQGIQQ